MTALVRAELLKVGTTRMAWALLAGAIVLPIAFVFRTVLMHAPELPPLPTPAGIRTVFAEAGGAGIFPLLLGIAGMAGEYRHQTITTLFLLTPQRNQAIVAKLLAHAILGLTFGLAAVAATTTTAVILLWLQSVPISAATTYGLLPVLGGVILATGIHAVIGVGLGALIRNQAAAIGLALIWYFVLEKLLIEFAPGAGKWLPLNTGSALAGVAIPDADYAPLPPWAAGLLFLGYGLALTFAATLTTTRRDVTNGD